MTLAECELPAPTEGLVLTHVITVRDVAASRRFCADASGGYLRDPDGYLIEVGQATGLLEGVLADRPSTEEGRNR